jgi:hypothetical protein
MGTALTADYQARARTYQDLGSVVSYRETSYQKVSVVLSPDQGG